MWATDSRLASLLATTLVLGVASATRSIAANCETVDLFSKKAMRTAKAVPGDRPVDPDLEWGRHATACRIGPFVVYGPAEGDSRNLFVTRNDELVFSLAPNQVLMFEGTGRLVSSLADRDADGRFDWLDYCGRDKKSGEDVWVFDTDFDGRTDFLEFKDADGSSKKLFQIEGVWLERVKKDGQSGFLVDGHFVRTRDEAAALLRKRHE